MVGCKHGTFPLGDISTGPSDTLTSKHHINTRPKTCRTRRRTEEEQDALLCLKRRSDKEKTAG